MALIIVIITVVAFRPGLGNEFLNWDDDRNFVENHAYRGLGVEPLRWAWRTYHLGVWQPLSWLILGLEHEIGGLDETGQPAPEVYHRFSLDLHALNAVVFFVMTAVILRIGAGRAIKQSQTTVYFCAAAAAVLFAVHPLRVEPVAWISSQPYLPAALFYMLGVAVYVWGHRSGGNAGAKWPWLAAVFICYLLAVGAKAVAVTMPVVLLILDVYPLRRWRDASGRTGKPMIRAVFEKVPFFLVAVCVARWAAAAKEFNESLLPTAALDVGAAVAQSSYGLMFYLVKTIAPVGLIAFYRLPGDVGLIQWPYGIAAICVIGITVILLALRRRCPGALAAWSAYVVILLPNLGIVQISRQIAADRYSYLAIMPIMVLFAACLSSLWRIGVGRRRLVRVAVVVGIVIACVALMRVSRRQVLMWRDSESLWRANVDVDPECAHAACMLGQALAAREPPGLDEAERHLKRAIELEPDFAAAYSNLGAVRVAQRQYGEAEDAFEMAISHSIWLNEAELAKVYAGLAFANAFGGKYASAWKNVRKAEQLGYPPEKVEALVDALRSVSAEPPGGS